MLDHAVALGYRRTGPPGWPKLDPFIAIIDQILEEDNGRVNKQRHTAKRIFERLRDEHGFTGGITIVTDYLRVKKHQIGRPLFRQRIDAFCSGIDIAQ